VRKYIAFILAAVLALAFSACRMKESEAAKFSLPFDPGKGVYVWHCVSGKVEEYNISPSRGKKLAEWASSLKIERREFEKGETPSDAEGWEVYSFEAEDAGFAYYMGGEKENYILQNGEWYYVKNPSDPSKAVEMEEIKCDLIPMVMINGEIYIDTGKESTVTGRCGVMDGEITSTVDGTEKPAENDQSNFGAGYEYQRVDANHVDVVINGKWMTFIKEGFEDLPAAPAEPVLVKKFGEEESKALSGEDSDIITDIFESEAAWVDDMGKCRSDCEITVNGKTVAYSSDCGTFNDAENERSFTVSEKERVKINEILEKYIVLGFEP